MKNKDNKYIEFLENIPAEVAMKEMNALARPLPSVPRPSKNKTLLEKFQGTDLQMIRAQKMALNYKEFVKGAWHTVEPQGQFLDNWHIDAICDVVQTVIDDNNNMRNVIINVPPRHSKTRIISDLLVPWVWIKHPWMRFLYASYAEDLSIISSRYCKGVLQSKWYKDRWENNYKLTAVKDKDITNDIAGYRRVKSVAAGVTGQGGHVIIADDPLKAQDAFSDQMRNGCNTWWDNAFSNRIEGGRIKDGKRIIIMQRLHDNDLTGYILANESVYEWHHLNLPVEYIPDKKCFIKLDGKILFEDPRKKKGEVLHPIRFGKPEVEAEKGKGNYHFCTPAESPILMADLSNKKIVDVEVGDSVVGFEERTDKIRKSLCPTKVIKKWEYEAEVFEYELDSGRTVRCTDNHKWYTGRLDETHKEYAPAKVGKKLMYVADPYTFDSVPVHPQDANLAGWLSGMFDGEGSATKMFSYGKPNGGNITFTQNTETNANICKKLEDALNYFGIGYNVYSKTRKKENPVWKDCNSYYIERNVPNIQKFLAIVNPLKWRDRIVENVFDSGTRFILEKDKIESITSLGIQKVYSLETETGNYICWGYASSNSSQYQQDPVPEGGGLVKADWIFKNVYTEDPEYWYENCSKLLQSWDLTFAKKENSANNKNNSDYVVGQLWGQNRNNIYLIDQTRARMNFPETIAAITKMKLDWPRTQQIIIEQKANGQGIIDTLKGRIPGIIPYNPENKDKGERLAMVSWMIEAGHVHFPDPEKFKHFGWILDAIVEVTRFPAAPYDDVVDALSQALAKMQLMTMLPESAPHGVGVAAQLRHNWRPDNDANVLGLNFERPWNRNWRA